MLLFVPLVAVIGWVAAPSAVRQRAVSVYKPHGTVDSNEHRRITRQAGIRMIRSSPWVGIGPNMVQRDFEKYLTPDISRPLPEGFYGHLHNLYLQFAAERGVPALLAFLWFIGAALVYVVRQASAMSRWAAHAAVAVILGVLTAAFFEVNLGDSEVLRMFLSVIACAYAVTLPERADA
jgi:O-antigen ligase